MLPHVFYELYFCHSAFYVWLCSFLKVSASFLRRCYRSQSANNIHVGHYPPPPGFGQIKEVLACSAGVISERNTER